MPYLDAWSLPSHELAVLLLPALLLVVPLLLPGGRVIAVTALALGAALAVSPFLDAPAALRAGWVALWTVLGVALWRVPGAPPPRPGRVAALETAAIGLAVGGGLVAVLAFGVAREHLPPADTRRVSLALAVIGAGLLHLMTRRHAQRAAVGFAALALGVQALDLAAHAARVPAPAPPGPGALAAGALGAALAFRIGGSRRRDLGGPWVSDAHDLHD